MTYYKVDFVAAKLISRPAKRFVTEAKAKQHARRVLGIADDRSLVSTGYYHRRQQRRNSRLSRVEHWPADNWRTA